MGPKVPKASARRFPRECASRGAARGAQDQAYALPRDGRAAARTLFFRVKRECGFIVPPTAAVLYNALWKPVSTYLSCPPPAACHFCFAKPTTLATPFFLFPQGDSRLGSDGGKADGGLKARAAGTVCLQTRAVARRRFQPSGRRHRNRSGGFCCFSPSKSREKSFPKFYAESSRGFRKIAVFTNFFFLYFWGQKYQKPPHVVFRGSARAAALHGARKIRPMRYPVTGAPQLAPSFSASNESADLLCRQRRHFLFYLAMHPGILFPQGGSRLGSDGGKADEGLKARAAGTVCLQTRAVARRRFQPFGRRHRNRSGGFCCFSTPKSS